MKEGVGFPATEELSVVYGEVTAMPAPGQSPGKKSPKVMEALEIALDKAPAPNGGDIQHYKIVDISIEYGGIASVTRTRVGIEVVDGPLP